MFVVIRTFRLRDDADERHFLQANERVQMEFSHFQSGFVRRTVAREPHGEWVILDFWGSEEEATAADGAAPDDPASQEMSALIDPSTIATKRFETLD